MNGIISASILSADFLNLTNEIRLCESAGVDWIHIDVMDGHFVPNLTMGPFIVEACKKITSLPLDCHLMVEKPEKFVEVFAKAGASIITIHPEGNPNSHRTLEVIKSLGCKAGIALNPGTPAGAISSLIPFADLILVMTVNPGFAGQKFIPQMADKVNEVLRLCELAGQSPVIEVDGGINPETILCAQNSGANAFVAATSIFRNPDGILAGVDSLRKLIH
ncbi:MAG: ribulose-phosphate 3-epimerase [Chloroflexi bacterium]|nr:MAG: ribulose-phosphate 3-epimerase [Chloroflexota bacterium]MBA4374709.1 ribulose-phosphate 3-epimerase [Anaerolinea sp.]